MTAVTLALRTDEREVLDAIRREGFFANDADVLRVAVWKLARHLNVEMAPDAFALPYRTRTVEDELAEALVETPLLEGLA